MMSRRSSQGNVTPRQRCISRDGIELALKTFANHLRSFEFDAAKADIEEEKSSFAINSSAKVSTENSSWFSLLGVLGQLASVEKAYFSMAFLVPKKVFRKEQTKINYNACRSELGRISATLASSSSLPAPAPGSVVSASVPDSPTLVSLLTSEDTFQMSELTESLKSVPSSDSTGNSLGNSKEIWLTKSQESMLQCEESDGGIEGDTMVCETDGGMGRRSLVDHFAKQFEAYVSARIELMEVYSNLSLLPSGMHTMANVLTKLEVVRKHSRGAFNHPFLGAIEDCFNEELEILTQLLGSGNHISSLRFLPAMMDLRKAHDALLAWTRSAEKSKQSNTHQSSWLFWHENSKKDDKLALFKWLRRFHDALLSKATFYFYEVLCKPCPADFAKQSSNIAVNYMQKIEKFHKRADAQLVALILDSGRLPGFESLQFRFPAEAGTTKSVSGLSSYPVIYSYPQAKSLTSKDRNYMPALVMWMSMLDQSAVTLGEVHHNSPQNEENFFVVPVEPHLFLFAVFSTKKHNRDSVVTALMQELYQDLHFHKLFMSMRTM